MPSPTLFFFFFFNDTATTEIYTLSLHDALPICLERNLPVSAHQQRASSLIYRLGGDVALHLALVGPEVRQHEERAADQAGPEREIVGQVEGEIEGAEPARRARQGQRVAGWHRALHQEGHHHRDQREDDEPHLRYVHPGP